MISRHLVVPLTHSSCQFACKNFFLNSRPRPTSSSRKGRSPIFLKWPNTSCTTNTKTSGNINYDTQVGLVWYRYNRLLLSDSLETLKSFNKNNIYTVITARIFKISLNSAYIPVKSKTLKNFHQEIESNAVDHTLIKPLHHT